MRRNAYLAMSPVGDIARSLKPTAADKSGNALRNVVGRVLDVGQNCASVSALAMIIATFCHCASTASVMNASIACSSMLDGPVRVIANHRCRCPEHRRRMRDPALRRSTPDITANLQFPIPNLGTSYSSPSGAT
jgi:hypothetical protein